MSEFKCEELNGFLLLISLALAVLYIVVGLNTEFLSFLLERRILKLITIFVVGYSISVSSVLFQTITNNRIITPSIIGFDSLYLMICSIVVLFFHQLLVPNVINIHIFFFITVGIMIVFSRALYRLLFIIKENTIYYVLLSGVVLSLLFRSIYTFFISIMDVAQYDALQRKLYASFDLIQYDLLFVSIILALLTTKYIVPMLSDLDVYLIGKDNAKMLGVGIDKIQDDCIKIISVLVSIATVLVGPIAFLGLFVVNIVYMIYSNSNKHIHLILGSTFLSWIILILGSLLVERVFEFDTNLTVIINGIGGIYFIYLLLKGRIK